MEKKRILVAEDDEPSANLLKEILSVEGYSIDISYNGKDALKAMQKNKYDALLTDWMMPYMDGIELIRRVRESIKSCPIIMVLTSISSVEGKRHAIDSGADDYITKPYDIQYIVNRLNILFFRKEQPHPKKIDIPFMQTIKPVSFLGICIAISSGGPETLKKILPDIPIIDNAAFFIVQHSPDWAIEIMVARWNGLSQMNVVVGSEDLEVKPGNIYVAPGDRHMVVRNGSVKIKLTDGHPENYVKPAADPLLKSIAKVFGDRSIAIIMTGMGCDGAVGAQHIFAAKGVVIVQDPETAVVPSMPCAVLEAVPDAVVVPLQNIPATIIEYQETIRLSE